jgi:hypothetical protein
MHAERPLEGDGSPDGRAASHVGDAAPGAAFAAEVVPPEPIREAAPMPATVLRVRDVLGRAIAGAAVAACPATGARNLSDDDRIGATDQLGEIVLPRREPAVASESMLVVSATGYVPEGIAWPVAPGEHEVSLRSGGAVQIDCRDHASRPLHGIKVVLSQVYVPASLWHDGSVGHTGAGSDARATIWHSTTDQGGVAVFEGLLPGNYHLRAESKSYVMLATGSGGMIRPIAVEAERVSLCTITCGRICVAALRTNVPQEEVLYHHIESARGHAITAAFHDVLEIRRGEIEAKFVGCQVSVSVAAGDSATPGMAGDLGTAKFVYSTLTHGRFVVEVPFVAIEEFEAPESFAAATTERPPTGEVVVRVEGDHGVERRKVRIELRPHLRSIEGVLCIEGEPRVLPAGAYVLDCHDRELATALVLPPRIDVEEGVRRDVVLRVKEGLVPLVVDLTAPRTMQDQYRSLEFVGRAARGRRVRTKGDRIVVWLEPDTYVLTARLPGCRPHVTTIAVAAGSPMSASIALEANR